MQDIIKSLQEEVNRFKEASSTLGSFKQLGATIEHLTNKQNDQSETLGMLVNAINQVSERLEKEGSSTKENRDSLNVQLESIQKLIKQLNDEQKEINERLVVVDQIEKKQATFENRLSDFTLKEESKQQINRLETLLKDVSDKLQQSADQSKDLRTEMDRFASLDEVLKGQQRQINQLYSAFESKGEELNAVKEELSWMKQANKLLTTDLQNVNEQNAILVKKIKLTEENEEHRRDELREIRKSMLPILDKEKSNSEGLSETTLHINRLESEFAELSKNVTNNGEIFDQFKQALKGLNDNSEQQQEVMSKFNRQLERVERKAYQSIWDRLFD
ncbi:hypothetical protein [Persicobacter psychrovividus]|uniref:Chromosome partition protein Smc n=1 Tax=Persicobacter psychrovividus TaxID=387638 RepID=A0ABN6L6X5_9BACT|nr:hypothetical protein PEPS_11440 [Persicobacter psychrovividus]